MSVCVCVCNFLVIASFFCSSFFITNASVVKCRLNVLDEAAAWGESFSLSESFGAFMIILLPSCVMM